MEKHAWMQGLLKNGRVSREVYNPTTHTDMMLSYDTTLYITYFEAFSYLNVTPMVHSVAIYKYAMLSVLFLWNRDSLQVGNFMHKILKIM